MQAETGSPAAGRCLAARAAAGRAALSVTVRLSIADSWQRLGHTVTATVTVSHPPGTLAESWFKLRNHGGYAGAGRARAVRVRRDRGPGVGPGATVTATSLSGRRLRSPGRQSP